MIHLKLNRRDFIRTSGIGAVGAGLVNLASGQSTGTGGVPTRPLGKTGERVSVLGLGGFHIALPRDEKEGIRLVREAIDAGVTFLDNAWEYHRGRAEEIMGKALQDGYRRKAFLMTKHHGRDKKTAMQHLEDSLRRLQTEVIDLWQFHEIIYEKDPEMIFAPGGGIEAAIQAKREGKVRFVGFTGHKDPRFHRKMLEADFPWDAVQMPLNVFDAQFERSFEREILPICTERGIGVLAMKALAGGSVQRAGVVSPREAHQYVYSLPISTLISGMETLERLRHNAETAMTYESLSEDRKKEILAKAHEAAIDGQYEPFKTSAMYDSRIGRQLHGLI